MCQLLALAWLNRGAGAHFHPASLKWATIGEPVGVFFLSLKGFVDIPDLDMPHMHEAEGNNLYNCTVCFRLGLPQDLSAVSGKDLEFAAEAGCKKSLETWQSDACPIFLQDFLQKTCSS